MTIARSLVLDDRNQSLPIPETRYTALGALRTFFERDGLDLKCEVPINLAQAMMGSKVKVRTADNRKVVLKIPAGTQSGTTFRIKGQGVEKGETRGDQLVKVVVKLPDQLSEEGREALEKLVEVEELKH